MLLLYCCAHLVTLENLWNNACGQSETRKKNFAWHCQHLQEKEWTIVWANLISHWIIYSLIVYRNPREWSWRRFWGQSWSGPAHSSSTSVSLLNRLTRFTVPCCPFSRPSLLGPLCLAGEHKVRSQEHDDHKHSRTYIKCSICGRCTIR